MIPGPKKPTMGQMARKKLAEVKRSMASGCVGCKALRGLIGAALGRRR